MSRHPFWTVTTILDHGNLPDYNDLAFCLSIATFRIIMTLPSAGHSSLRDYSSVLGSKHWILRDSDLLKLDFR